MNHKARAKPAPAEPVEPRPWSLDYDGSAHRQEAHSQPAASSHVAVWCGTGWFLGQVSHVYMRGEALRKSMPFWVQFFAGDNLDMDLLPHDYGKEWVLLTGCA